MKRSEINAYRLFFYMISPRHRLLVTVFLSSLINLLNLFVGAVSFLKFGSPVQLTAALYYLLVFLLRLRILRWAGQGRSNIWSGLTVTALYLIVADLLFASVLFYGLTLNTVTFGIYRFIYSAYALASLAVSLNEIFRSFKSGGVLTLAARSLSLNSALFALFNILNAILPVMLADKAADLAIAALGVLTLSFLLSIAVYLLLLRVCNSSAKKPYNENSGGMPQ